MKKTPHHLSSLVALSLLLVPLGTPLLAQPAETPASSPLAQERIGTVTGRVLNSATGQYLNNARVSVQGTDITGYTDETGTYRLTRVPTGRSTLEVSFTGMETQSAEFAIEGTAPVEVDVSLTGASVRKGDADVIQLDAFTVTARPIEGAAIAIQEQRVATNIKTVVSSDEFGLVPDGNIGEFLKLMPGIAMATRGGDPREVFINGAPSSSVPITVDGFGLASSEISGTGRNVELNNTSINTISRIEAVSSVNPDTPASALAGLINLVPRSSFERAKPEFKGTVYLNWRDTTATFGATPGPRRADTHKVRPGFELSWVYPVNKKFGFTISAGASTQYLENSTGQRTTRGSQSGTNGIGFPTTTVDQPYLSDYLVGVQSKIAERSSLGLTADYRLGPGSTLSFGFQFGTLHTDFSQRNLTFLTVINGGNAGNKPIAFDSTMTHGGIGKGQLQSSTAANNRYTQTWMPTLRYRHKGPVWSSDAGIGYSRAMNTFRNFRNGIMQTTSSIRNNVTVNFDNVDKNYVAPAITVFDGTTGAVVDPYNISSFVVQSAGNNNEQTKEAAIMTAFGSLERQFDGRWPISVKVGFQVDENMNNNRSYSTGTLTFLGADGKASTAPSATSDDGSAQFYDPNFTQHVYLFGAPAIQWVDNEATYENYIAHPEYWTVNTTQKNTAQINASKFSDEYVTAAYVRGDIDLFTNLHLSGGVRAEQTNVRAAGPLTDAVLGLVERGYHVKKEYFDLFPSLNARYMIRDDLIFRVAYYKSIGRPDFGQYSGGLTLPSLENPPSSTNRLSINNAGIEAWTADTVKASLEYYFPRIGKLSVSAFRRDYTNFFGSVVSTPTPELLELYGLDYETYKNYDIATQSNLPDILRTEGLEVSYNQALTFLPHWARGVQVFGNVSWLRFRDYDFNSGSDLAISNFGFFVPRIFNYGISLTRPKFNVRFNANVMAKHRQNAVTGAGIEAGTYAWKTARTFFDISGEYSITKRLALFGSIRNVNDEPEDVEVSGPHTPATAVFRARNNFYALVTFGVKGTF